MAKRASAEEFAGGDVKRSPADESAVIETGREVVFDVDVLFGSIATQSQDVLVNNMPFTVAVREGVEGHILASLECTVDKKISTWEVRVRTFLRAIDRSAEKLDGSGFFKKHPTITLDATTPGFNFTPVLSKVVQQQTNEQSGQAQLRVTVGIFILTAKRTNELAIFDFFGKGDEVLSNGIVQIGERRLAVSKEILASHSGFFRAAFFSNFSEAQTGVVQLQDVTVEDFVELLYFVYPSRSRVTAQNVEVLLRVADRLDVTLALVECQRFLLTSNLTLEQKLLVADQCRLHKLMDQCMAEMNVDALIRLRESDEFDRMSQSLRLTLGEKAMTLVAEALRKEAESKKRVTELEAENKRLHNQLHLAEQARIQAAIASVAQHHATQQPHMPSPHVVRGGYKARGGRK